MKPPLLWPSIFAACGLMVLVALGVWQLQRLVWKQDLTARIEARAHAAPVPLDEVLRRYRRDGDIEYSRVRLEGAFNHAAERHLYTVDDGKAGWRIITPLRTEGGRVVLVDRGFVPLDLKEPEKRLEGQVVGATALTGLARLAREQGLFTPDNEPEKNIWFWRDIDTMAGAGPALPFLVEAERSDIRGGWPRGGVTRLSLHNRHLEYALTWFGLALALSGVFAAYVRSVKKTSKFT